MLKIWTMITILVTLSLKMILLWFCITNINSIFVRMHPPNYDDHHWPCDEDTLTVLTGADVTEYYTMTDLTNSTEELFNVANTDEMRWVKIYRDDDYEYMVGGGDEWFEISDWSGNISLSSHNDDGYQLYYYYCGDLSSYLQYPWISVLLWIVLIILPPTFIAVLHNITNISVFKSYPGFFFISLISYFHIGSSKINVDQPQQRISRDDGTDDDSSTSTTRYRISNLASLCNMLISLVSLSTIIFFCSAGFGQGDGRHLR